MFKTMFLSTLLLSLAACGYNPSEAYRSSENNSKMTRIMDAPPTYSDRGSYDDNGAEPAPNAGNQNFGRRW